MELWSVQKKKKELVWEMILKLWWDVRWKKTPLSENSTSRKRRGREWDEREKNKALLTETKKVISFLSSWESREPSQLQTVTFWTVCWRTSGGCRPASYGPGLVYREFYIPGLVYQGFYIPGLVYQGFYIPGLVYQGVLWPWVDQAPNNAKFLWFCSAFGNKYCTHFLKFLLCHVYEHICPSLWLTEDSEERKHVTKYDTWCG